MLKSSLPIGVMVSLMLSGCGPEDPPRVLERSIINGKACSASEMPSSLAILIDAKLSLGASGTFPIRSMLCTGTLIAPDVVLTAAHCVFPDLLTGGLGKLTDVKYHVSFTPDLSELASLDPALIISGKLPALPTDAVEVSAAVPHPKFDVSTLTQITPGLGNLHDIGLVFLSKAIPLTQIQPAIAITKEEAAKLIVGKAVEISGWGQQTPQASDPFQPPPKGTVGVKVCATSTINEIAQYEMQIGAGTETSRKCHGDSGGPSYATVDTAAANKTRVVGITSHAYDQTDCAKGGIDTRLDAWLEWVDQEMKDGCAQKTRAWCDLPGVIPPSYYDPKLPEPRPDLGRDGAGDRGIGDGATAGDAGMPMSSGCSCTVGSQAPAPLSLLLGIVVALLFLLRRGPKAG